MHSEPENTTPFAEGPKLEFELLLTQLIDRAHEVLATQVRLRQLIRATNSVVGDLDLSTVLTRIAESARQLVGARYAAMGVIGEDGQLEQFIHVGMDEETVAQIDHLPEGKGLLGALILDPQPVRLQSIASDQRSSGFPAHHPPMESFLGVPIRVRNEVYGNLYLTDQVNGAFSADDEQLAQALAASAGIAISNARLFEESQYRERLSSALADINRQILANDEEGAIELSIKYAMELGNADLACVVRADAEQNQLVVTRAAGHGAEDLMEQSFPLKDSVAEEVLADGKVRTFHRTDSYPLHGFLDRTGMGEAVLVPFDISATARGLLVVARSTERPGLQERDRDMATSFADQVTLAVQRSEARAAQRHMEILEDRSRIARDLHDHVIQRLFAAGLSLQAVASGLGPSEAAERITVQIRDIDETIAQIRQSIFALRSDEPTGSGGLRARISEVVDRVAGQLPPPTLRFLGPVDLMSDRQITDDVAAVVTESLANVIRHAEAHSVSITVSASKGQLSVDVIDDGKGTGDEPTLSGLVNLRVRALEREGGFSVLDVKPSGTHLNWWVPV